MQRIDRLTWFSFGHFDSCYAKRPDITLQNHNPLLPQWQDMTTLSIQLYWLMVFHLKSGESSFSHLTQKDNLPCAEPILPCLNITILIVIHPSSTWTSCSFLPQSLQLNMIRSLPCNVRSTPYNGTLVIMIQSQVKINLLHSTLQILIWQSAAWNPN